MMTFAEFLTEQDKRGRFYGSEVIRRKKATSQPSKLGISFTAVNPANLGLSVAWDMGATPIGRKSRKKSGVIGRT